MIYITQLIYVKPGQEAVFDEFEKVAIPIVAKYNGRMLFRIRPTQENHIMQPVEAPYEVHLATFDSEADFEDFKADKERTKFLHLKDASIEKMLLIKGTAL
jgi:hypothetical protein